jgi:hypothetical protein
MTVYLKTSSIKLLSKLTILDIACIIYKKHQITTEKFCRELYYE